MANRSSPYFRSVSSRGFRDALSRFASGVTVITAAGAPPSGVTISAFCALSLNPPLVLFCLDEKSRARKAFKVGVNFAAHILAEDQQHLAHVFSLSGPRHWKKLGADMNGTGAPALKCALAVLQCRVEKMVKGGDHRIIIGRVRKIALNEDKTAPLLHSQRAYYKLGRKLPRS
ncbi:MAG TPA: flavin reductase family protein [Alphaproteobacteria bacterium]|nr:flavin reductase family protein [Alphaproteobacteria bacterium]